MSKKLFQNCTFVQFVANLIMMVVSFGYSAMYVISGIIMNVLEQTRIFIKVRNQKIGFVMIVLFKPRAYFLQCEQIQILCNSNYCSIYTYIIQIIATFIPTYVFLFRKYIYLVINYIAIRNEFLFPCYLSLGLYEKRAQLNILF